MIKRLFIKLLSYFGNSITTEWGWYKIRYVKGSESGTSKYGEKFWDYIGIEISERKSKDIALVVLYDYSRGDIYIKMAGKEIEKVYTHEG